MAAERGGAVCGCRDRRWGGRAMTLLPAGVKVHLAFGYTEMRKGMEGLAVLVHRCPAARPAGDSAESP